MNNCQKRKNKNADGGFVAIRRGIYEHLSDGRMTGKEWMVYSTLHLKADHETGICYKISGPALGHLLRQKPHYINRVLRSLEAKGYIKRISFRGQVVCYPVVINKFLTSNGILIDAAKTKSLDEIAWYVEQDCTVTVLQRSFNCTSNVLQMSCLQEVKNIKIIKQNSKKNEKPRPRKGKGFVPPTLDEVKKYIKENPELSNIDPVHFWKSFNDSDWIDTQGKPVRNWKLKIRTWSKMDDERKGLQKTGRKASKAAGSDSQATRKAISDQDFGDNMLNTEQ
jgi:hypothetical protein